MCDQATFGCSVLCRLKLPAHETRQPKQPLAFLFRAAPVTCTPDKPLRCLTDTHIMTVVNGTDIRVAGHVPGSTCASREGPAGRIPGVVPADR
jgi:hypothetical protein